MTTYQSSNFRRQQTNDAAPDSKYKTQVIQLQELFPSWSNEGTRLLHFTRASSLTSRQTSNLYSPMSLEIYK